MIATPSLFPAWLRVRTSHHRRLWAFGIATATAFGLTGVPVQAAAGTGAAHGSFHIYRATLTPEQIRAYSQHPNQRVIVIMRNQFRTSLRGGTHALAARSTEVQTSQRSVASELHAVHARNVRQYRFMNAVAATVSRSEADRLRANPQVAAVIPDAKIMTPKSPEAAGQSSAAAARASVNRTAGACGTAKKPLLQPEALKLMHAATAPHGETGKGVKVAVFPDGLDPKIRDFIRPNGKRAIFDYRDFTGTGPNGKTGGGEAFGDASSLISQGRRTFDLSKYVNPALPLPAHCDIRIKGIAPDAQLAVMKVFGTEYTFTSTLLQGLDWAVSHDHVNVLSESFGGNPIPDAARDAVSIFDANAVAHGITVVASTGDAGTTNTEGSPASTSSVIGVAATTSFQSSAQLSEHGYQLFGRKGWESNNISAFSSSGFTQTGPNAPDVVAPGDGGWSDCSTKIKRFSDCADLTGGSRPRPPIELFGGTSESCPLTAGVAALVIQAYKSTHNHAPSPAVVKRIITSTATNLGAPAQDQGAGLVDAQRAVQLARSYKVRHHAFKPVGRTLSFSRAKIETTAAPGSARTATIKVTNEGTHKRTLTPRIQSFGATRSIMNTTVNYDPATDPTYLYWLSGLPQPYAEKSFTVPAGYQRLDARVAYPADPSDFNQEVFEELFDPSGRIAADSEPQGAPNGYGEVQVRNPRPGTWHAIYFFRPASDQYTGPIAVSATVQKLVSTSGPVRPRSATLASGASKTFTVHYRTPGKAGDAARAVSFGAGSGAVPVLTRSLVMPTTATPGTFSAELTAGNGRMFFENQEQTFAFNVPAGVHDLDADIQVADPGYELEGVLVDPTGSPVDVQDTTFVDLTTTDVNGFNPAPNEQTLHLSWQSPQPGQWHLVLGTVLGSSSGKTSSRVSGTVSFNTVHVTSALVPDSASTTLTPDVPTVATITVTNTGNSPEIYYVDPRTTGETDYSLGWLTPPSGTLPITPSQTSANIPLVLVPPATTQLGMVANSNKAINLTTTPNVGEPEVVSSSGKTAVANYSAPDVAATVWGCPPTLVGPFKKSDTATFACSAFGVTRTINDDIAATGGNLWDTATDVNSPNVFDPTSAMVVPPGSSTVLTVTITPSDAEAGSTVSGYLAIQTLNTLDWGSDDLVHIPYEYSVANS